MNTTETQPVSSKLEQEYAFAVRNGFAMSFDHYVAYGLLLENRRRAGFDLEPPPRSAKMPGFSYYHNSRHWVGTVLSRMVKRGLISRAKPGVFTVPARHNDLNLSLP